MRLYQITEAISLTKLDRPLVDIFNNVIVDVINQMANQKFSIDADDRRMAIKRVSLTDITRDLNQWLLNNIDRQFCSQVMKLLSKELDTNVTIKFSEIKPAGYASGLDIVMNKSSLESVVEQVRRKFYNHTMDSLESEGDIFDNYFRCCERYSFRDLEHAGVSMEINRIVSVIIHEAVHIAQHNTQYKKHRYNTEYRSYLQKDKNKFHQGVNKMVDRSVGAADGPTPEEYDAYLASPQEINARSQQAALEFIRDFSDSTAEEMKQNTANYFQEYMEKKFKEPTDRKRYPIYKRFTKQAYQEVMRLVAELEKKEQTPT